MIFESSVFEEPEDKYIPCPPSDAIIVLDLIVLFKLCMYIPSPLLVVFIALDSIVMPVPEIKRPSAADPEVRTLLFDILYLDPPSARMAYEKPPMVRIVLLKAVPLV